MLNHDEAQSSNALMHALLPDSLPGLVEAATPEQALLERLRDMRIRIDASAMHTDSEQNNVRLDDSFSRLHPSVWDTVAERQKRYGNFGGIRVYWNLKKNPLLAPDAPVTGLHASLQNEALLHTARFNLMPVSDPWCHTGHSIDRALLLELAPRITQQGQEENYPAFLRAITRSAFQHANSLAISVLSGGRFINERAFAKQTLDYVMNNYLGNHVRAHSRRQEYPKGHPDFALSFVQKLGSHGLLDYTGILNFFIVAQENYSANSARAPSIVRDISDGNSAQEQGGQSKSTGYYGYFEGPIISVDASHASMRQKVRDLDGREYEREHTGLSPHMLQRIEAIRKGWVDEPVAVDVINGQTQVAPLECAQRLSLDAAYTAHIVPRNARVVRVNATLQENTPPGTSYKGQFLGTTAHHVFLRNLEGNYEAHLKCLFHPQDLAKLTSVTPASWNNANLLISYSGPMRSASMSRGQSKIMSSLKTGLEKLSCSHASLDHGKVHREGNYKIESLSLSQALLLEKAAIELLKQHPRELFNPTQAISRTELARLHSKHVHAAILTDNYDDVVLGRRPGDRSGNPPAVSESGSDSTAHDFHDAFSLGAASNPEHLDRANPVAESSRVSTRSNSPARNESAATSSTAESQTWATRVRRFPAPMQGPRHLDSPTQAVPAPGAQTSSRAQNVPSRSVCR